MEYGYANANAKMAASTQIEIIRDKFPKLQVVTEPKGSKDEWNAFFGKQVFLNRGTGHRIVIAEFHHLASNRDELIERVAAVHERGSWIMEAKTGRSTENPAMCPVLINNAIYFYETGLSPERRSEIAAHAAKFSPVSKIRTDRVPHTIAVEHLDNMAISMPVALALINATRDVKGKKYKRPWTKGFAYRERRDGRISFRDRPAGPPVKRS